MNSPETFDETWKQSNYPMEERRASIKLNVTPEERVKITAFNVEFDVPKQEAQWCFSSQKIEEKRQHWIDHSWYPPNQTDETELLQRQNAANLIQQLGFGLRV